jgi:phospho-N-acetylmuramoyl-pentapeptide-transferase
MIYYILYELIYNHFKEKDWFLVKASTSFSTLPSHAYASITALLISLFFGGKLIEALRNGTSVSKFGRRSTGIMAKRGTPTMGGVLIVGSVLISTLLWARLNGVYIWTTMLATGGFAAIGFVDDYSKMAKKQSLGLTGRQKLLDSC